MPSTDTLSDVPYLQQSYFPSLEESVTPNNFLSMETSDSTSDVLSGTLSEFPSE